MKKIAALQMVATPEVDDNLKVAADLIAHSAYAGAEVIILPEDFAIMGMQDGDRVAVAEQDGEGPIQEFLQTQAVKNNCWLVAGSVPIKCDDEHRTHSACLVNDNKGERQARYDKIHLFDVQVKDNRGSYQESKYTIPGAEPVVVETPVGKLGLAICYDLRFPELFRKLTEQGTEILIIAAAFTEVTGRAHWETLLRARAIENLSYVVASAQGGTHINGRQTFGHSMIIEPWGEIQNCLYYGAGVVLGEIDLARQKEIREKFPVLQHRHW